MKTLKTEEDVKNTEVETADSGRCKEEARKVENAEQEEVETEVGAVENERGQRQGR